VADQPGVPPQAQLTQAVAAALTELPATAHIGVMPWANATIPLLVK